MVGENSISLCHEIVTSKPSSLIIKYRVIKIKNWLKKKKRRTMTVAGTSSQPGQSFSFSVFISRKWQDH